MDSYKNQQSKSINELAEHLAVSKSTLRYWEDYFQIIVERTSKNSRKYSNDNIEQFEKIKEYVTRGYALKDIKDLLNSGFVSSCNGIEIYKEPEPQNNIEAIERLLNKIDKLQEDKARLIAKNEFLELQNREYFNKITMLEDKTSKNIFSWITSKLKFKAV